MPRPDEGLIHAWLDGQLPPEEAARIEELAATDPEWAAAVAEARGLVAASSRILSALDHVPAGVVPKRTSARTGQRLPWWTKIAAAVVVVVGGSVVVLQNAPDGRSPAVSIGQGSAQSTTDTQRVAVAEPVTSPQDRATATPETRARVPAATGAGSPVGAVVGKEVAPARRREAFAAQATAPVAAPALPPRTDVAAEQKAAQDAERMAADVSAPKSVTAKAAPSIAPGAAQGAAQGVAQNVAPNAAPQAQQASLQDVAQAQNAARAQRALGEVAAMRGVQEKQEMLCYRLVPDSARAGVAVIMRVVRRTGDTLYLASLEAGPERRAWLALRDRMKGVMTTSADQRSTVGVAATPTACPAP